MSLCEFKSLLCSPCNHNTQRRGLPRKFFLILALRLVIVVSVGFAFVIGPSDDCNVFESFAKLCGGLASLSHWKGSLQYCTARWLSPGRLPIALCKFTELQCKIVHNNNAMQKRTELDRCVIHSAVIVQDKRGLVCSLEIFIKFKVEVQYDFVVNSMA